MKLTEISIEINSSNNVHSNVHELDQNRINKELSVKPKQSRLRKNKYSIKRSLMDEINTTILQKEIDKDKRLNARLVAIQKRKNR